MNHEPLLRAGLLAAFTIAMFAMMLYDKGTR